jgi:hypothetical protein
LRETEYKQRASSTQTYTHESQHSDLIRSLLKSLSTYASEHYPASAHGVYPYENKTAILLVANKYSPSNFWFLCSTSTLPLSLSPFATAIRLTNMFSFLRPWASQPPPLKDDPTGGPSPTGSDHHHYLSDPDSYQGPVDVTPADMPELFDILLSDIDEKVLHDEISTALGSAYLSETPHLTSPHATVDGIMFGRHNRVLFPLVVRLPPQVALIYHTFLV